MAIASRHLELNVKPSTAATLAAMDKNRIGSLLRDTRIARGISYRELAELTGLSTRSIQQMEDAENNYGIDTLAAVCKVLELDINVTKPGKARGRK